MSVMMKSLASAIPPFRWVRASAVVFDVLLENFEIGSANGTKEETVRSKRATKPIPIERIKLVEQRGCTSSFEDTNRVTRIHDGQIAKQKADVVELPAELSKSKADAGRNL
jgi:hypothetical protein